MPKKASTKNITRLIKYIKKDRPKKFKAYVNKYDVDIRYTVLPKGRTLLHYEAKHGSGNILRYLLRHGALASQSDVKGDLPLHLALDRALQLAPADAAEVYSRIVIPLLKDYPGALYFCDHHGASVSTLLTTLNRHILTGSESDSDSESSDSEWSDGESSISSIQDWSDRLKTEFENENVDFFGRYDYSEDYAQEHQKETYQEWIERMGREMYNKHKYQYCSTSQATRDQKRKHASSDLGGAHSKRPRVKAGINIKEKINNAKSLQNIDTLRKTYEEKFQAALNDKNEKKIGFGDIPWPSKGSIENVMEVLFGDKADWSTQSLKKYIREQQIRWHPDKFLQKFIDKIAPKSFEKVMERVKEISQALNKKADDLAAS